MSVPVPKNEHARLDALRSCSGFDSKVGGAFGEVRQSPSVGTLNRPVEILLVEDNPGDVELTALALQSGRVANRLHVVEDGLEALAFLHREGLYVEAPRPDLILLDLNLPRKDGRETLAEIKKDPRLCEIPVVVLTTSEAEKDIADSYSLHANCFITKPVDLDQFLAIVSSIEHFWFTVVKLPPAARDSNNISTLVPN